VCVEMACVLVRVTACVQFLGSSGAVKCHRTSSATFVDMAGTDAVKSWPLLSRQLSHKCVLPGPRTVPPCACWR
jgi:hypothetical protein